MSAKSLSPHPDPLPIGCGEGASQNVAAPCPFCARPGVYIRTRRFSRGQIAHVWTCSQPSCAQFHLYWHTDQFESLPQLHPQCRVIPPRAVVRRFLELQRVGNAASAKALGIDLVEALSYPHAPFPQSFTHNGGTLTLVPMAKEGQ